MPEIDGGDATRCFKRLQLWQEGQAIAWLELLELER